MSLELIIVSLNLAKGEVYIKNNYTVLKYLEFYPRLYYTKDRNLKR
jgi:hypothetical protein